MKYRLYPEEDQEQVLVEYCGQARWLWNQLLAARKDEKKREELKSYPKMCKHLTKLRAEYDWLREGSQTAQQQSLKDLQQSFSNHFQNPGHFGWPTWRKHGVNEGFRIVGGQALRWRRLNRHWAQVLIPKVGWVRFRWSRHPGEPRSYRIKKDAAGRWWISFASIPEPKPNPENNKSIGIDCGVACSFATSEGEMLNVPNLSEGEEKRLESLQQQISRQQLGSKRREKNKRSAAKIVARGVNRKKDIIEKTTTRLALEYEHIYIEDLNIKGMTKSAKGTLEEPGKNVAQKRGLNRSILGQGWGLFAQRLEDKAPGRVYRLNPAYSSQCCSACRHVASESRESQATFRCVACGYEDNADVNAAKVLAAGHAVSARRSSLGDSSRKREPQLC